MLTSFSYPEKPSYVPVTIMWPLVTLVIYILIIKIYDPCLTFSVLHFQVPMFIFVLNYLFTRHSKDLKAAVLGHTLSFGLNGVFVGEALDWVLNIRCNIVVIESILSLSFFLF